MERGTLVSGSDLTWILPHWLSIPLGDHAGACTRLKWTHACLNRGTLWMKTLVPELQTGGEIILLKWRIPHPPKPLTRPPVLVDANLNEIHQWTIWMKCTEVAAWLITILSNISFPWQTGRVYIDTDIDTHLPSFIRNLKECRCCAIGFQSIWCWSRVPIIFCFFCSRSL